VSFVLSVACMSRLMASSCAGWLLDPFVFLTLTCNAPPSFFCHTPTWASTMRLHKGPKQSEAFQYVSQRISWSDLYSVKAVPSCTRPAVAGLELSSLSKRRDVRPDYRSAVLRHHNVGRVYVAYGENALGKFACRVAHVCGLRISVDQRQL
jgi:hypothetical protein